MAKKRGLGRGLDALLGSREQIVNVSAEDRAQHLSMVPVDQIQRGAYQPRIHFDSEALQELADSISAQGVVQPVVLRQVAQGYELIAGERRWRAAQLAGLHEIPAVIRDLDDRSAAAVALIENIQREDLNALEEARAFQRLIDDFALTHQQVADAVGRSRAAVSNFLRLLDLGDEVQHYLAAGELEMGHARALLALSGVIQVAAARTVINKNLTVRATEALVKQKLEGAAEAKPIAEDESAGDPNIRSLEQSLGERIGVPVRIKHGQNGKGKLLISYNSLDELDGILEHIQ
ncbi:MAG: ParB/RepB/Spo0J family partition protein [Gammaproteobacteria bacterium]|nr:ParB/RepB/Spo0J family partition protein [Gammaproteobacteria bacterium]